MGVKFANNASTVLTNNITNSATVFDVDDAAIFPAAGGADYVYLTLTNLNDLEIIKVTDITGNTLTCLRAQDNTSAFAFNAGEACDLRITTAMLLDALAEAGLSASEQTKFDGIEALANVTDTGNVTTAGAVMNTRYNDNQTILVAVTANVPSPVVIPELGIVGRKTGGDVTGLVPADIRSILNVEDGADVTDETNVNDAGAIMISDIVSGNSIITKNQAGTLTDKQLATNTLLGRQGGEIDDLTATETKTILDLSDVYIKGPNLPAANTMALGVGDYFNVTGNGSITDINTKGVGTRVILAFAGTVGLIHSGGTLDIITGVSITATPGDSCMFVETSVGGWTMEWFKRADGTTVLTAAQMRTHLNVADGATNADVIIQIVHTQNGNYAEGSVAIPETDDSIPQNTEGTQFMTKAITPTNSSNNLLIEATLILASESAATFLTLALFKDSQANALLAMPGYIATANTPIIMSFKYLVAPADTTSSVNYKIRVGGNSTQVIGFNGRLGAGRYGGIQLSSFTITEYVP